MVYNLFGYLEHRRHGSKVLQTDRTAFSNSRL